MKLVLVCVKIPRTFSEEGVINYKNLEILKNFTSRFSI